MQAISFTSARFFPLSTVSNRLLGGKAKMNPPNPGIYYGAGGRHEVQYRNWFVRFSVFLFSIGKRVSCRSGFQPRLDLVAAGSRSCRALADILITGCPGCTVT